MNSAESGKVEQQTEESGRLACPAEREDSLTLRFETWAVPGDIFNYLFKEQYEEVIEGRDAMELSPTLNQPILTCAIVQPDFLAQERLDSVPEQSKGKEKAVPADREGSSSEEEDDGTTGRAWLTHKYSPLHETVQAGYHSWILLAKEKGFQHRDGSLTVRPNNFPKDWIGAAAGDSNDSDNSATAELPWIAQLMLVWWTPGGVAGRIAIGYLTGSEWDVIVKRQGERRTVLLR